MYFTQLAAASLAIGLTTAAPAPAAQWGSGNWGNWGNWGHHGKPPGKPPGGGHPTSKINVQLGPRPFYLVDNMDEGPLKDKLESCKEEPKSTTSFSISHRGAPLMFPEHSKEGYNAAARMGAGIIECDVSFTSDRELVCRHSNCDLHYTTNILAHPDLAAKCTQPFTPANPENGTDASAKCCTSDITLAEFKSLCAEMEATTFNALSVNESTPYFGRIGVTPDWRTNMYAYSCAETMSLKDQIQLVEGYGLNFTAEAKTPEIPMPFQGDYTQEDFAQQIVDTFQNFSIAADRVWLQSFLPDDIFYWLKTDPAFGAQAVYLDERADLSADGYQTAVDSLPGLAERGVQIIAPSIWQLITADNATGQIVPSSYAIAAQKAGLEIITWSFERSGPLEVEGGGYYYESVANLINNDGDEYTVIDVIAQQVGATKIFADWAGTITYYANCFGLV
ncbi:hypothetical protein PRZ48_003050 [Zasmidium cellare]|uniref:glycerophosphodiester phosphodiesterase n=1 Tax=Zasmidium cellare TaxID=395010 RepID=A0ABR0EUA9_ZASCE|nr:hypothetical protein PRZ48_003050 [Zasmidium cellare]